MFGYILANQKSLSLPEQQTYRAYYCGLCHALHEKYGATGQITLNYDMTFVYLLLSSLYEAEEQDGLERCLIHPVKRHRHIETLFAAYAADMNILLSYYDLMDDWTDEKKLLSRAESELLKKHFTKLEKNYPRQADAARQYVQALHETESKSSTSGNKLDLAGGLTGTLMEEILLYRLDEWEKDLRSLGFFLGKFIYLMDAYEDIEKDLKKKRFNPFEEFYGRDDFEGFAKHVLTDTMAECAKAFERMPVLENAGILRNILYSGVWTRYELVNQKRTGKGGK